MNFVPGELAGLDSGGEAEVRAQLALASYQRDRLNSGGLEIYLEEIMGTGGNIPLEIPVHGGDMIIIPESGRILVEGEVENRGVYELGQRMSLLGALAAAGGITYGAKVDEVEVVREFIPQQKVRLVLDLQKIMTGEEKDIRLRNGDLVRVPSDSSRRLKQDTFEGITRIINFGVGGTVNLTHP